jgi:predicted AlkP superfamily phosphohydrolase/phosphomutase
MKNQTLVIGLDGATFDVALPLIETGHLPNLAHLKAEGTWGNLRSVMHPESAQAWSSFLTGTNPGRHGIFGFTRRAVDSYNWLVNTSNNRVGPDIAEVLAQQGKQAGLFNVPLTYPPHQASTRISSILQSLRRNYSRPLAKTFGSKRTP